MVNKIHTLKSWSKFFRPIYAGTRTHELRRNDRNFQVGDTIVLCEFDELSNSYSGAKCTVTVTSITSFEEPCAVSGEALDPAFCILSIVVVA